MATCINLKNANSLQKTINTNNQSKMIAKMQTNDKVLISNITSDKVIGKDIIDGGLHHFVCDKTYPNGKVVKQTMCVLADETFKEVQKKDTIRRKSGTQLKKRRTNTMPTLTTQMTKALDTWTPTGCQGELLRADEVNLYYQNARLGRVDYMTVHEGISDKTIEHSCKLAAYSEQDLARLRKTIFAWQRRNHCKKQPERWQFRRSTCYDVDWSFRFEPCDRNDCSLNVKEKNLSNEPEIVITCIEVKSSLNDFSSINGHNLVGNCNYYLMPYEMKHKVIATEIPPEIGVLAYDNGQIRKVKECKYRKISYLEQSWLLYSFTKRTYHRY